MLIQGHVQLWVVLTQQHKVTWTEFEQFHWSGVSVSSCFPRLWVSESHCVSTVEPLAQWKSSWKNTSLSQHPTYLMDKKNKHLLSRGKMVMNKILSKTGLTEDQIIALDSTRRNQVFETTFFVWLSASQAPLWALALYPVPLHCPALVPRRGTRLDLHHTRCFGAPMGACKG